LKGVLSKSKILLYRWAAVKKSCTGTKSITKAGMGRFQPSACHRNKGFWSPRSSEENTHYEKEVVSSGLGEKKRGKKRW